MEQHRTEKMMTTNLCQQLVSRETFFGPARPGDIRHSNADIGRAKELLGYDPDWSFERGIQAAISWYRDNL